MEIPIQLSLQWDEIQQAKDEIDSMIKVIAFFISFTMANLSFAQIASEDVAFEAESKDGNVSQVEMFMREAFSRWDKIESFFNSHELEETVEVLVKRRNEISPLRTIALMFSWKKNSGELTRIPQTINGIELNQETKDLFQRSVGQASADPDYPLVLFYLRRLLTDHFSKGEFYFAGDTIINNRNVKVVEFFSDQNSAFRKATFLIIDENKQFLEIIVEMDELKLETLNLRNSLPEFVVSFMRLFVFEDVSYALKFQQFENGWLPESIHIKGTKRRVEDDLQIEYIRKFINYRKSS